MKHTPSSPTPALVTFELEFSPVRTRNDQGKNGICGECPKLEECRERVANDGPAYCEFWDEEDVFIAGADPRERLLKIGQFKKGHKTWNKGMKGMHLNLDTEFKPGHRPHNTVAVGTEVERKGGFIYRKIAEPNVWRSRAQIVWEEYHRRSLSEGWIIRHRDEDSSNDDPYNLRAMPRSQNLIETLKDPDVLRRKKEGVSRAMRRRWKEYRKLRADSII